MNKDSSRASRALVQYIFDASECNGSDEEGVARCGASGMGYKMMKNHLFWCEGLIQSTQPEQYMVDR
jgi:hypothetical protein